MTLPELLERVDEPYAWIVEVPNGNVALWSRDRGDARVAFEQHKGAVIIPVYRGGPPSLSPEVARVAYNAIHAALVQIAQGHFGSVLLDRDDAVRQLREAHKLLEAQEQACPPKSEPPSVP